MQTSLFCKLVVSAENLIELPLPIAFDCMVKGKKLKASITHLEKNTAHYIYHISFSDGHTASFVAPREGGKWHDERFASPYARAIADDLNALCGFLPVKPPFSIRLKNDREAFNVWVVPYNSRDGYYSIFYKGHHQFDLRKTNVWEAKEAGKNADYNQEIAAIACKNIEQRMLQLECK